MKASRFHKGAQMKDPKKLFNTRMDSKAVRAIDFHEGDTVDVAALKALILDAARVNMSRSAKSKAKTARSSGRSNKRFSERVESLGNPDSNGEPAFLHRRTNS